MNVYCYPHLENTNDLHCVQQNIERTGILQYTCVKHIGLSPHVALGSMKIAA